MHSKIMVRRMLAEQKATEQQSNEMFHVKQRQLFMEMVNALKKPHQQSELLSPAMKAVDHAESTQWAKLQQDLQKQTQPYSSLTKSLNESASTVSLGSKSSHSDKWEQNYQDLLTFRKANGHCLVPYQWSENKRLAHWVKRQRYHYKLKKDGMRVALTDARQEALEKLGFVWEPHDARWEERLNDLRFYKKVRGTCNVRSTCTYSPRLADWVKSQRRNYRNFIKGKPSKLTQERIKKLDALGFIWNPRDMDLVPDKS